MILFSKQILKARLRFIVTFFKFKYFLIRQNISVNESKEKSQDYIIILAPWLMTSTPWFAITTGLLLFKKGHKIQYLIDDIPFEGRVDHHLQIRLIRVALSSLKKLNFKIEFLSTYSTANELLPEELIIVEKLAVANAIHKNRGEEDTKEFKDLCDKNFSILKSNFPFVKSFIQVNIHQTYIFSGGIYANSGLFEVLSRTNERSYFTFDSGFEVLLSTYKGVAAQFTDVPTSLELLLSSDKSEIERAKNYARVEFEKRKNGTNKLNSQYQSYEDSETFDNVGILIPLNSPWDSAALNIASLYSGYNNWLLETVKLILENSHFNITIRQHPDERFWWGKTKTDFNQLIKDRFDDKRIQFVSCFDKVNSYALLNKSEAVICYSSTFGIEAAMAGKAVCVCSNVYYSKLGFVYKPQNVEGVKFFLKNTLPDQIHIDKNNALLTYYLGQQCNWLFTPFTPTVVDLDKWLALGLENLLADDTVDTYINSLEYHKPMSLINHQKSIAKINSFNNSI